jgi:hypothetical protein
VAAIHWCASTARGKSFRSTGRFVWYDVIGCQLCTSAAPFSVAAGNCVHNKSKSCTTNPQQIHNRSNKWSLSLRGRTPAAVVFSVMADVIPLLAQWHAAATAAAAAAVRFAVRYWPVNCLIACQNTVAYVYGGIWFGNSNGFTRRSLKHNERFWSFGTPKQTGLRISAYAQTSRTRAVLSRDGYIGNLHNHQKLTQQSATVQSGNTPMHGFSENNHSISQRNYRDLIMLDLYGNRSFFRSDLPRWAFRWHEVCRHGQFGDGQVTDDTIFGVRFQQSADSVVYPPEERNPATQLAYTAALWEPHPPQNSTIVRTWSRVRISNNRLGTLSSTLSGAVAVLVVYGRFVLFPIRYA